jgi:hypothetical protein
MASGGVSAEPGTARAPWSCCPDSRRYWVIYVFLDGDEYLASDALLGVKDEFVAQVLDRLSQSAPRFFYRYSLIAAILSVPPPTA